jgi:hypothetical protein
VHLLLSLVDLAAGLIALAWPGQAEENMLVAKNRRQPPAGRGEAGIGPGASAPRPPNRAGHCVVAGSRREANQSFVGFYR